MGGALDQDQFVKILEQKIERAKKSLKMLSLMDQIIHREKIDRAYAVNIDLLRNKTPVLHPIFIENVPADHRAFWCVPRNGYLQKNRFFNQEYPDNAVTFSLPGFSFDAIVPNLDS
jgi:hypothetical protein